jgi:spermidine synthase
MSGLHLSVAHAWCDSLSLHIDVRGCLHARSTPFQRIAVYDSYALGRVLTLGDQIALCEHEDAAYNELIVHPGLQLHPHPQRVLVLGGGDGGVARQVLHYDSVTHCRTIEIDEAVVEVCREYFPDNAAALDDPRAELTIDDAYRVLTGEDTVGYDVVIVDSDKLYAPGQDLVHNATLGAALAGCLTDTGLAVVPLGSVTYDGEAPRQLLEELSAHFQHVHLYAMNVPALLEGGWTVAVVSNSDISGPHHSDASWVDQLDHWSPAYHAALFSLPPHITRRLGR